MEKMNRFEFMKNVKLCLDGSSAQYLKMNLLQKKVISAFEKKESFLVISPRQTGRTFSIFFNLLYEIYCNNFLDTIIVTNEVCRTENIVQKVISYTWTESGSITKSIIDDFLIKIDIKTKEEVSQMSLKERANKRLVILEAAAIDDSVKLESLLIGWEHLIIETGLTLKRTFNSSVVRYIVDYGLFGLKYITVKWNDIFEQEWYDRQIKYIPEEYFDAEIMLKWGW